MRKEFKGTNALNKKTNPTRVARRHPILCLSYSTEPASFTQESSLIKARVSIPYIWEDCVGAKPARVAHLILEPSELLDLHFEGAPSDRYKQHRGELANL